MGNPMSAAGIKRAPVFYLLALIVISCTSVQADVSVSVGANCQSFSMTNATPLPWKIGGIRFFDKHTYWAGVSDGEATGWTMTHATVVGRMQQDLYFNSMTIGNLANNGSRLIPDTTVIFNSSYGTAADTAYPDMYVLLRTGAPGIPDDPTDAAPLTILQLDSVIANADFYNPAYKYSYTDSLGVNGGKYSGGFIDTWYNRALGKAETQIQFPIPPDSFVVNATKVDFVPTGMNQYWMSLAIGQEYFHADMQWMAAQGAKETGIGTNFPVAATNQPGVYGFWQIENASGLDRALIYPSFFPKYSLQLARAVTAATSGINSDVFMTYYTRGNQPETPINSALLLNSCVMSIIFQYVNYYMCACAADICWMNSLAIEKDPYMGVAFMAVMYNLGDTHIADVAALLNPNAYQGTCANANAHTLMGSGNSNYVPDILTVVQAEENASQQYEKNNIPLNLVDFQITERGLWDMFFGDNGTVAAQGNGGLLLHYYDPAAPGNFTAVRQQIWNTLDTAFNILKGKAPTASATTISYRYDFLAALRTVKAQFPFIKQKQPSSGDAATLIPQYSTGKYGTCSGAAASDETYPYLGTSATVNAAGNMTVYDTVTDETLAKSVKWTLDYNWMVWNDATPVDTTTSRTRKIFRFTALKTDITSYQTQPDGQSGHYVWVMASDASGNSIFKKIAVTAAKYPTLDSAIIQDVNGDGLGDKITAYLTRSTADSADQISQFSNFQYSWPLQTPLIAAANGVTAVGNTLVYAGLAAVPGAGLGRVTVHYPSKTDGDPSTNLLDRVGPALSNAMSRTGQTTSAPDTLVVTVTEPIRNLTAANTVYLNFKKAGTTTSTPVPSMSVVKQGTTGANWIFVFPSGTLAAYDSVNLVTTPGLVLDTVGNPPLAINRMVRIQKGGNRYPALDSAIIQDVNGDGLGDRITAYLTRSTADSSDSIGSFITFQYSWPTQTILVTAAKTGVVTAGGALVYAGLTPGAGAGLGRVVIAYPSKPAGDSANLLDRVGPALSNAMSRAGQTATVPDTLVVTVTEPIRNLSAANTAYLNFKTAGTTTKTAVASVSVVKQGTTGTSWVFVFPNGALAAYDSVNFVTTPGLILDTVGNPPLDINRMVRIQKQGAKYPSLDSAIIQDVNGDGLGDRITAYLTPSTADSADQIDSFRVFQYSWPVQTSLVTAPITGVTVAGNTLVYAGVTPSAGAGLGRVVVNYKSFSGLTVDLSDRVGPALTSAIAAATKNTSIPDTLVVTVTEPIQTITAPSTAYLNFKTTGGTTKTSFASTSVVSAGSATSWKFIFPGGTAASYDSVNFMSTSGLVFDAVGNPPLAINRMVAIQKQTFVVSLARLTLTALPVTGSISAGDSVVFIARVIDDTGGVRPEYDALIAWPALAPAGTRSSLVTQTGATNTFHGIDAYKTYTIKATFTDPANPSRIFSDSARVSVVAGQPFQIVIEADTVLNLNAPEKDTVVSMSNATNSDTVYAVVRDALGNYFSLAANAQWSSHDPGIASAGTTAGTQFAGIIRRVTDGTTYVAASQTGLRPDSVLVEIAATVLTALHLVNAATGDTIKSILMKDDQQMTINVIGTMSNAPGTWIPVNAAWALNPATLQLSVPLPAPSATSWTFGPTSAGQTSLTVSSGALSVTVPIKVTAAIRIVRSIACDNPFTPGVSPIPAIKRGTGDALFGTRIEVTLSAPPVDNAGNVLLAGTITIFDAVGNVIAEKKELKPDGSMLYAIWDGTNRRGVHVSAGSYLGKIEIINKTDNTSTSLKTLIGVR